MGASAVMSPVVPSMHAVLGGPTVFGKQLGIVDMVREEIHG